MTKFPHVQTKRKGLQRTLNILAVAFMLAGVMLLVLYWSKLPESVAIHYNWKGEADGWGSKYTLILLPIIAFGLFMLLSVIEKKPQHFNYIVQITEQNAQIQYELARDLANITKNLSTILLMSITYTTIFEAIGIPIPYSNTIFVIFLVVIILVVIIYTIRSIKHK